jgi:hypothetical protein
VVGVICVPDKFLLKVTVRFDCPERRGGFLRRRRGRHGTASRPTVGLILALEGLFLKTRCGRERKRVRHGHSIECRGHWGGPRTKEGRPFLGGFCTPSTAACCPAFPEAAPNFPVPVPNLAREELRDENSARWAIPFTIREDQLAWQQG